jgi:hypothetical protein
MTDIANDMRRLDEWMRDQDLDMKVPDYIKSSPFDAAVEIEEMEEINKLLIEAAERFVREWRDGHVSVGAFEDAEAAIAKARWEA